MKTLKQHIRENWRHGHGDEVAILARSFAAIIAETDENDSIFPRSTLRIMREISALPDLDLRLVATRALVDMGWGESAIFHGLRFAGLDDDQAYWLTQEAHDLI